MKKKIDSVLLIQGVVCSLDKNLLGIDDDEDYGPNHNEWETTFNEPDYSDYREITHAVTRKLVRNAYFKAFRGSRRISPAMRYQTLPTPTSPYLMCSRIYNADDHTDDYEIRENSVEKSSLLQ